MFLKLWLLGEWLAYNVSGHLLQTLLVTLSALRRKEMHKSVPKYSFFCISSGQSLIMIN